MAETGSDLDQLTNVGEREGLQIPDEETTALVPYMRGISLGKVVKATLARFLPGTAIAMGGQTVFWPVMGPDGP